VETAPLRERRDDIPLLAAHFLQTVGRRLKRTGLKLTQGDVQRLSQYDWPGNVRELENVIERATILAREGRLRFDLPEPRASASKAVADQEGMAPSFLTEAERRDRDRANIMAALESCGGKVFGPGGAAAILGVKPTTLASRVKTLGIRRERTWS
jgi:transcriptional regulator with GAF, ATPase, and Fis domain